MNCIFCSWTSIEAKQLSEKKFSDGWHNGKGLQCTSCRRFSCYECLAKLSSHISDTMAYKYQDSWCQAVCKYIRSGVKPSYFIGTCCENKLNLDPPCDKKNNLSLVELNQDDLDGALFLEDFNLFIDSPFSATDIHGFGKVGKGRGTRHCVMDPRHVCNLKVAKIFPIEFPMSKFQESMLDIKLPWSSKRKKIAILDERPDTIPVMSSGENEVPGSVVQRSFYYSGQRCNEHIDVTIILGRFRDQPYDVQLLLMRFHGKEFTTDVSASVSSDFYRDISKIISKNHGGFVCHRFGGSSGLWNQANDDLLKFLHHPGNFPRKAMVSYVIVGLRLLESISNSDDWVTGKGVKIVPMGTKLRCFYFNTVDLHLCQVDYSIPRRGGKFKMPHELLLQTKYKFLFGFIESKLVAALLLDSINRSHKFKYRVNSPAINNEIQNIRHTQAEIKKMNESHPYDKLRKGRSAPDKIKSRRRGGIVKNPKQLYSTRQLFLMIHSSTHCTYTLVQHCVGMHEDFFDESGSKSSLENKRCFVNKEVQGSVGRGGMGSNVFVYALLDW